MRHEFCTKSQQIRCTETAHGSCEGHETSASLMHGLGPSEFTGLFVKVHMFAGAVVWDDMLIIVCHVRVERVVISGRRARRSSAAGFTEPVGSGPETVGSGPIGPDRFRFRPVPNRSKFKI
jgi:hypothetical protein